MCCLSTLSCDDANTLPNEFRRKLEEEKDAMELDQLNDACMAPGLEGLPFATEILENTQADIKQQFKEVFQELKDTLEVRSTLYVTILLTVA